MPKMIKKRGDHASDKINIKFDIPTLNSIIKYTMCEFVPHAQLTNLTKLLDRIDINTYNYSPDIQSRIKLISALCDATVNLNLKDPQIIESYILEKNPDLNDIVNEIKFVAKNELTSSECRYISQAIDERLQYSYIFSVKDNLISTLEKLGDDGFVTSYYSIVTDLKTQIVQLMSSLQNSGASDGMIQAFNFSNDQFAHLIDVVVQKAKRPASILQTGIRQLNSVLSPGFQSGRLYTILGGTGKFKSGTLLNIADMIRKYNPQIIPVEDGMRKTVLYITCENSIYETIERLFDMYSDIDDNIADKTAEEVIDILKNKGGFKFTDSEGIDIDMRYYSNLDLKTSDIYSLIQDLANDSKKVICVILDYIKRIESAHDNGGDERVRISYASKELKSLAQYFEIPVITAMQINREGNGIIDAAMRENKQDVANFIGTSNVGVCWDLIEESDMVILINLEMRKSTNTLFLSFKRLKIRGKKDPHSLDYFNHPFENEKNIRLAIDVDKEKPVSVLSLSSDLESVDERILEKANSRPRVNNMSSNVKDNSILKSIDLTGMTNV